MIRVATYVKEVDKAIELANQAYEKGYETTNQHHGISKALDNEADEALDQIRKTDKGPCRLYS